MRTDKQLFKSITLTALVFTGFAAGSIAQVTSTIVNPEAIVPVILTATPTDGEVNVDLRSVIEITFSSEMDETTINGNTLTLHATSANTTHEEHGEMLHDQKRDRSAIKKTDKILQDTTGTVNGTISYSNKVAAFTPDKELKEGTHYTFTVTNGVKSSENITLENDQKWSFTTKSISDSTYSDNQNSIYGTDRYGMDINEYSESTIQYLFLPTLAKYSSLQEKVNGKILEWSPDK